MNTQRKTLSEIALGYLETIEAKEQEIKELKEQLNTVKKDYIEIPNMHSIHASSFFNLLKIVINNKYTSKQINWVTIEDYASVNSLTLDPFEIYDLDKVAEEICKSFDITPKSVIKLEPFVRMINSYPSILVEHLI